MTIKLWRCTLCETPCVLSYDILISPNSCPYPLHDESDTEDPKFELIEVDETELIKLFTNKGEHYHIIPGCEINHGICPKTSNGECDSTCEVIKRVNRSS